MEKYYNKFTKILTLPPDFNEQFKDIPDDVEQLNLPLILPKQNQNLNFEIGHMNCEDPYCPKNLHFDSFSSWF